MFGLKGSSLDLLHAADYVYEFQRQFDAPGDAVFRHFFDDELRRFVSGMQGFTWHTTPGQFDAAVVDEAFIYMSLRMRTVAYQPGARLAMSVDRCSLPLGRQMLQVMDATPRGTDGCYFRWRIAVRYLPGMAPLAPAVTPLFRRMFQQTLDAVARKTAAAPPPRLRHRVQDVRASSASGTVR
jgi:hypothetical protein